VSKRVCDEMHQAAVVWELVDLQVRGTCYLLFVMLLTAACML
jgi:hypothetical protein